MVSTRSSKKAEPKEPEKREEKADDKAKEDSSHPEIEKEETKSTIELKLREKKPLPDVKYLLQYGDPDAPPQSAKETFILFGSLFVCFVLSFFAWHFLFLKDAEPGKKMDLNRFMKQGAALNRDEM